MSTGSPGTGPPWLGTAGLVAARPVRSGGRRPASRLGNLGVDISNGRAYAASFDGSVVVGQPSTPDQLTGFRWQAAGGMQQLPMWQSLGTSADGSVAVGMDKRSTAPGQVDSLGFLGGNNYTSAYGVSGDGQTVVGYSETSPNRYAHAFRWTPAGGIQDLGVTTGTESLAWGVSANASSWSVRRGTRSASGGPTAGPRRSACGTWAPSAARRAPPTTRRRRLGDRRQVTDQQQIRLVAGVPLDRLDRHAGPEA